MKNRFNNLNSKEWLPFQKSWFKYTNLEKLYRENVRFFMKFDEQENPPNLLYIGDEKGEQVIKKVTKKEGAQLFFQNEINKFDTIQFVIIDFLNRIKEIDSIEKYSEIKKPFI